jgi:ABC-2 type transport system ATP-binding protein
VRSGTISELVSSRAIAFARSPDLQLLLEAVRGYPEALSARVEGEGVAINLKVPDTAALNRYLSEREIYLSHLSLRQQSLEEVFLELTAPTQSGKEAA